MVPDADDAEPVEIDPAALALPELVVGIESGAHGDDTAKSFGVAGWTLFSRGPACSASP